MIFSSKKHTPEGSKDSKSPVGSVVIAKKEAELSPKSRNMNLPEKKNGN